MSLVYLASADLITGTYDEKTQEGALKLQQINSLSEDGKVGSETMNLLYSDEIKANTLSLGAAKIGRASCRERV